MKSLSRVYVIERMDAYPKYKHWYPVNVSLLYKDAVSALRMYRKANKGIIGRYFRMSRYALSSVCNV